MSPRADFVDRPNPAFTTLDKDNTCVLNSYQLRARYLGRGVKEKREPRNSGITIAPEVSQPGFTAI